MQISVAKLSELDGLYTDQAISVFVEGFYNIFSVALTKDKQILHELFMDSIDVSTMFVCLQDGCVMGILGLGNSQKRPLAFKEDTCRRLLGKFRGSMFYRQTRSIFEKPIVNEQDEGHIDYLATASQSRSQGAATRLIQHVCDNLPYNSYTLEVFSKNERARRLYQKLGFRQIKVQFNLMTIFYGWGKPITMRLDIR